MTAWAGRSVELIGASVDRVSRPSRYGDSYVLTNERTNGRISYVYLHPRVSQRARSCQGKAMQ